MIGYNGNTPIEWVSLKKLARFLRVRPAEVEDLVAKGRIPCAHGEDGPIFPFQTVLLCLNYKMRTRTLMDRENRFDRDPIVYGYARASHRYNSESDCVPAQVDRVTAFIKDDEALKELKFGGVVKDLRTSAYKIPFFKREGGKMLARSLRKGDHVVIDKLDRIWRDVHDCLKTVETLKKEGVTLHIVDLWGGHVIDTSDAYCNYMLINFINGAQFQSAMCSNRQKANHRRLRENNYATGQTPFGMRVVRQHRAKWWEWDPYEHELCNLVVTLHDDFNLPFRTIADIINDKAKRDCSYGLCGRLFQVRKMPMSYFLMQQMYVREKNMRVNGLHEARLYSPMKMKDAGIWKTYRELRKIRTVPFAHEPKEIPYAEDLSCSSSV